MYIQLTKYCNWSKLSFMIIRLLWMNAAMSDWNEHCCAKARRVDLHTYKQELFNFNNWYVEFCWHAHDKTADWLTLIIWLCGLFEWVSEWVSEWAIDWLIDWLSEWVSEWVSVWASRIESLTVVLPESSTPRSKHGRCANV